MDDLEELARANQSLHVNARRAQPRVTYVSAPSQRKGYSPFSWGIGLTLGVVCAIIGGWWGFRLYFEVSRHGTNRIASALNQVIHPKLVDSPAAIDGNEWVDGSTGMRIGDFAVWVESVKLLSTTDPSPGRLAGEPSAARMQIALAIQNQSGTMKVDCHNWSVPDQVGLRDNFGNLYKPLEERAEAQFGSESIYPKQIFRYQLVFEPPVRGATHLNLELPGEAVGVGGAFRLRLAVPLTADEIAARAAIQAVEQARIADEHSKMIDEQRKQSETRLQEAAARHRQAVSVCLAALALKQA